MMRWIKESLLMMVVSVKQLLKGKQTVILILGSLIVLAFMLMCMDEVKEEKSKITIGIVNEDGSELSENVMTGMRQKDLYEIVVGDEKTLVTELKQGKLSAVCVIKEGFSDNILIGKTNNLITIYETENREALLLGDILAGVMMQEICTAKSYQTLLQYQKKSGREPSMSPEEYRTYVNEIMENGGTEFSFDAVYLTGTEEKAEKPSQAVVYEQAIFAVFALMTGLVSMYSVLPFWQFCHGRLAERMSTLPIKRSTVYVGSAMAGLLIPVIFACIFLMWFSLRNAVDFSQILSLLICTVVYVCVIVSMMLLAAAGIKNQTVYQMGMLAMILVFGVFGLVSLVDGILVPEGTAIWIPNGWYVRKMTELIH